MKNMVVNIVFIILGITLNVLKLLKSKVVNLLQS